MAVATPVAPTIAQSATLLESDEADSEPPQKPPSENHSDLQASPRQAHPQSTGDQSQRQFSDGLSDELSEERLNSQNHDRSLQESGQQNTLATTKTATPAFSVAHSPAFTSPTTAALSPLSPSIPPTLSASPLSPPRQFPTSEVEVHDTIPEEDDETDYDTPNEPVTPVSGRQSRDGFHPAEPEPESTPLPKPESGAAAVPLPLTLPTHPSAHQQHKPHSHHGHKNHNQRHPRHQRTLSNASANGDSSVTTATSHGSAFSAIEKSPSAEKSPRHLPPPLSTSGSNIAQQANAAALRPESPSTRPTTAVAGSFLINPPNGNAGANSTSGTGTSTEASSITAVNSFPSTDALQSPSQGRRPPRNSASTSSFKRTMSSLFRRTNSQSEKAAFSPPDYSNTVSDSNLIEMATDGNNQRKVPSRRWSMHRSLATTQSNSPPSPGSPPLEMIVDAKHGVSSGTATGADTNEPRSSESTSIAHSQRTAMPTQEDFLQNDSKKHRQRATTTLSLHNAIHIVTGSSGPLGSRKNKNKPKRGEYRRRASSFDQGSHNPPVELRGEPWALPAEAGTGLKARRMSLSLPDDFTVDIADLHSEFDYQHMLGRHRRHLGKGATSKVTLMFRKGFPDELYAVKEFRGKSTSETREEYEKKVKSEYSIAKSLHHPNIVETVRLCTDHGRWDHVMEYCQEGDLYSLVEKKYLTSPDREKDRQCLFKQLIQGLNYLHSHGIAHRDIKLENLLITNNSKLKITDFGASDIFSGMHPGLREAGGRCGHHIDNSVRLCKPGICGSLPYISPEVLEAKDPYDPRKLDVWASAIVMLNLIFGAPLWGEARLKPGQQNPQYLSLIRGWEKWNKLHLPGKQDAEKQHAERQAAEKNQSDGEGNERAEAAPLSSTAGSPPLLAAVPTNGIAVTGPAVTAPKTTPTVDAAPITDGNPNSLVEGPYPIVMALDAFVNPPILRRIIIQMLNPDPKRRVTIEQVANLRWIRNIECCQPECYEDPMAPPVTIANVPAVDASKRSTTNFNGQKIFRHDHLPPKIPSHSLVRVP